jgi:aminomethyltransferase
MAPFAGWDMPIQYTGILKEHEQTRKAVSVFDTCHMGEFEFTGPDAARALDRLLTQCIETLRVGQARYGYLLREDGGTLDDVICFRLADERFLLVVNAGTRPRDAEWVRAHLPETVGFRDLSDATGKLDVQGPLARSAVEAAFSCRLPDLGYFCCAEMELGGTPVLVSRTGYTGEFGYELYFPAERAESFWDRLTGPGGVLPAGLGARDTLRLEMGYPLYGHELSEHTTPAGAARKAFLDLDKPFLGRDAVRREIESGRGKRLVGLRFEGRRSARAGDPVHRDGVPVGSLTSGSYAPSLGVAIALASVEPDATVPGTVLSVPITGASLEARVVRLPFYEQGTARNP